MSEIKPWKTLSSEVVFDTEELKIKKDVCLLPDGVMTQNNYVRDDHNVALVFCVTKSEEVVLVRQYRHGADQITLELPGGKQSSHDLSLEDTARRELLEETGYSGDEFKKVASFWSDAQGSTRQVEIFYVAGGDKVATPRHVGGEYTEVLLKPLAEIPEALLAGEFITIAQIASVHHVLAWLNNPKT